MPGGKNVPSRLCIYNNSKGYCTRTKIVIPSRKAENRGDLQLTLDDLPGFNHCAS